jgi:hypothetical protein
MRSVASIREAALGLLSFVTVFKEQSNTGTLWTRVKMNCRGG